jgi:hypothetical protein
MGSLLVYQTNEIPGRDAWGVKDEGSGLDLPTMGLGHPEDVIMEGIFVSFCLYMFKYLASYLRPHSACLTTPDAAIL